MQGKDEPLPCVVFHEGGYVLRQEPISQVEAVRGVEIDHLFNQAHASLEEEAILVTARRRRDLQISPLEYEPLRGRSLEKLIRGWVDFVQEEPDPTRDFQSFQVSP